MIVAITLSVVLAALHSSVQCTNAYNDVFVTSSLRADKGDYVAAAALREDAGHIYQECLGEQRAPKGDLYPIEGASAYMVAAIFWHLAGNDVQAQRVLTLTKETLSKVTTEYPPPSGASDYGGNLQELQKMIHNATKGKWGVWGPPPNLGPVPDKRGAHR